MKVLIVYPNVAPGVDGIGDHTLRLSTALQRHVDVSILARSQAMASSGSVPIMGILPGPPASPAAAIVRGVESAQPNWLIVQYNPFSWGRWGLALDLPNAVRRAKRSVRKLRVALLVHEPFVPPSTVKNVIMTTWQRLQLWELGRLADVVCFSTEPWAARFEPWFRGKRLHALPSGSGLERVSADANSARTEIGIDGQELVLGVFGTAHPSRLISYVRTAYEAVADRGLRARLVYVGPDGHKVRQTMEPFEFADLGRLPGPKASKVLGAMDVYLAPFSDGVSIRRTSFMAGLQHGVAIITTTGPLTGPTLASQAGEAYIATPVGAPVEFGHAALRTAENEQLRRSIAMKGRDLFERRYSWPVIADQLLALLD